MNSSLALSLFDFVPVMAFLVGGFFLVKISARLKGKPCARMAMAGALLVFLGGFLKAVWKFLYTTGIADIQLLSELQFVLSSIGFLAFLVVAILLARRQGIGKSAHLPAMLAWKIPFLAVMTLASMGAYGILTYFSFKRKARWAGAFFIIAFLGLVAMGALASGEQTLTRQWIEEGVNAVGQIGFMLGSILLYRDVVKNGCD